MITIMIIPHPRPASELPLRPPAPSVLLPQLQLLLPTMIMRAMIIQPLAMMSTQAMIMVIMRMNMKGMILPSPRKDTLMDPLGQYVVWHHIVALVVLIVVASLGCILPMVMRDNQRTRYFVQCGKYFGAGVVLSVAFVHIMPEALFALTHPCLSTAWTEDYPGYAPLIMMMSGLTMLVIEYLASSLVLKVETQNKKAVVAAASGDALEANAHAHFQDKRDHAGHASSASSLENKPQGLQDDCNHAHGLTLLQCGPGVSTKVSTYMLEAGITLHSVFIGISLGVLAGSEFLAMTIAICFHQFFEGIALGSRIADLTFRRRFMPFLLVAIFALITPVGIAIGMGMRTSYKANSVENLIIMGVCNSIACGVLIYTAYVTLLGGDILYSERFRAESRANKASYLVAVWLGAIAMAIIALWA
ncbi:high-affinity Zn(2+) transporter zrt1 [Mortierella alpina]|nr:high-affinity Zn(2+) transporter zrt1 [Mortierella alpina]